MVLDYKLTDTISIELIIHADGKKVAIDYYGHFIKKQWIEKEYCVDIPYSKVFWCMNQIGKEYSFKSILGFAIQILAKLLLRKELKNPYQDGDKSFVCSEFIGRLLCIAEPESMSPVDIMKHIEKHIHVFSTEPRPHKIFRTIIQAK